MTIDRRLLFALITCLLLTACASQPQPIGSLPGSYRLDLTGRCELLIFTEDSHVEEWALALACPGIDLLRVFPWPPVQPWDESPSHESPSQGPLPEATPTPVAPTLQAALILVQPSDAGR